MEGEGQSFLEWVWNKLKSLFKLFIESVTQALQSIRSFVISSYEKLRELLSIFSERKSETERIAVQLNLLYEIGSSHEMKLDGLKLVNLAEGLIKVLAYA